jgi:hypothetical protein
MLFKVEIDRKGIPGKEEKKIKVGEFKRMKKGGMVCKIRKR